MGKPLRALVVEDVEADALLLVRELKRGGFDVAFERVDTPETMSAALAKQPWDIVISDYSMPKFSAPLALAVTKERKLDLPFIIVSGTVNEEIAVEAMRAGAHDFMAKGKFARLIPAIERELREAEVRAEGARMQQRLRVSDRMGCVGMLAAGVAHDFNNILSVILSYAGFIREGLPEGDERVADIDEVLKAADRAVGLTRQLLTFARRQPKRREPSDLNERLAQLEELLRRTVGANIELSVTPAARTPVVLIDPVELDQVVLNLVVNGRDAMPNGGRLCVALEYPSRSAPTGAGARMVRLTVTDTGTGMDEPTRQRIFEPFFTTKEQGRGTGLGLATCFSIVEGAGGAINVESALGRGTTFAVDLPVTAEAIGVQRPQERVLRTGRGENVLVVEDEPAVNRATARVLQSAGYAVHTAADGTEAVALVDALGSRLDVVVADVVMPGRSGYDVAEHASRVAPGAAVILTSGYLTDAAQRNLREDLPLLWKPVPERELLRAVEQAISARRTTGPTAASDVVASGVDDPASDRKRQPGMPVGAGQTAGPVPSPTAKPEKASRASRPAPRLDGAPESRRERVLLVDDDESLVAASARILANAGFEVVVAGTVAAARQALAEGELDALVTDVGLPDGSGLDLLQSLRGESSELPVVMITGAPSVDSVAQALRSRVHEYLPKPFVADDLVRVVRSAVDAGRIARLRTKLLAARFGGDEFVRDLPGTEKLLALALRKIRMAFQPIVRSGDGSVFGYEALLRCDEPSLASPLRLLAAAEVLGRVNDVGRAVRASVAATMVEHRDRQEAIFVNIHPSELRADVLAEVTDPLIPLARRVVLEVTERASLEGGSKLDDDLRRIRDLGYRLAVDDLGEGYAGLSSLVHLRPDIAKIDMSLVRDVHRAPLKRDIVAALVDMARRSGIVVVAEGVETVDERDTLVDLGCDLLQGYLFAKPAPPFPVARTTWDVQ